MNSIRRQLRSAALAAICAALCVPAAAQDEKEDSEISRVVVTAQKREQAVQEVPVSITTFTKLELERSGINEFTDYATRSPNVGFSQQGNRAFTKIGIRGVTNIGGRSNSIGIYLDEFNIAPNVTNSGFSRTFDTPLYDIQRIEILRGPQGTYFGRNTLGGAINITTVKPDPVERFGSLRGEFDEHGTWLGRLSANLPLTRNSAVRLTGYYRDVGDWIDNLSDGGSNDGRDRGIRTAYRYSKNRTTIDVSVSYTEVRQDQLELIPSGILASIPRQLVGVVENFDQLFAPFGAPPIDTSQFPDWPLPATRAPFWPDNSGTIDNDTRRRSDSETAMVIANIDHRFSNGIELTSVTGYIDNDFSLSGDGDASPFPSFRVSRDSTSEGWSQELRLSSFDQGRLDWTVGSIYSEDEITETDVSTHLASDPFLNAWGALLFALGVDSGQVDLTDPQIQFALANGLIPETFAPLSVANFEDVDRGIESESFALFGDITYALTDQIDLTTGLRWTQDDVTFSEVTRPTPTIPVGSSKTSEDFSNLSPRVVLSWDVADNLSTYAKASRGYKVGGINSDVTLTGDGAVEKVFDDETAWNYEIGFKGLFLDNRLRANLALFYIDWEDIQVRGQDVLTQRNFVQNATSAASKGGELELLARVTQDLTWNLGYGFTDSTFDSFPNAIPISRIGTETVDASGNDVPFSPENTLNTGIEYRFPGFINTEGWFRFDYRYVDSQQTEATNNPTRKLPAFDLFSVRIGFDHERFDFSLYVDNLFDEEYIIGNQNLETYYSGLQLALGQPRTFGGVINVHF